MLRAKAIAPPHLRSTTTACFFALYYVSDALWLVRLNEGVTEVKGGRQMHTYVHPVAGTQPARHRLNRLLMLPRTKYTPPAGRGPRHLGPVGRHHLPAHGHAVGSLLVIRCGWGIAVWACSALRLRLWWAAHSALCGWMAALSLQSLPLLSIPSSFPALNPCCSFVFIIFALVLLVGWVLVLLALR